MPLLVDQISHARSHGLGQLTWGRLCLILVVMTMIRDGFPFPTLPCLGIVIPVLGHSDEIECFMSEGDHLYHD